MVALVVQESVLDDDLLARITTAEDLAAQLVVLGDELVNYFVDEARAEGRSWTDIGSYLGLSRQGAQQRYRPRRTVGSGSFTTQP
jgi:hypothetical protein